MARERIKIGVGVGIEVMSGASIALSEAQRPLLWTIFAVGALIVIWGLAPIIADWIRPKLGAKGRKMLPILTMAIGIAIFAAGAIWFYVDNPSGTVKSAETTALPMGQGGRGGDAKVRGSGIAIGGPGGHAGRHGIGGAGGGGELQGDGIAAGGAGGSAGDEGVWRAPAKSGYEVYQRKMGLPVDPYMRQFGRGGAGAGYEPKLQIIEQLRADYFREHAMEPKSVFEDIFAVPLNYLNDALAAKKENWRARIVDEEYEFFIP
jgi:hypothetical protein